MTEAPTAAQIAGALAEHDAKVAVCPFMKPRPFFSKVCPVCSATSSEPCRKRVIADADFVSAVRAILMEQDRHD